MNITPDQLENKGYQLFSQHNYKENLLPLIIKNLKSRSVWMIFFWGVQIVGGLVLLALIFYRGFYQNMNWAFLIATSGLGLLAATLWLPIHEFTHVLVYKFLGAKNTSYDANWKRFYFVALADRFVVNYQEFIPLALGPFVVISIITLSATFYSEPYGQCFWLAMFLSHSNMCAGDFALLNFMHAHRKENILTFEDVNLKMSYFYTQRQNEVEA